MTLNFSKEVNSSIPVVQSNFDLTNFEFIARFIYSTSVFQKVTKDGLDFLSTASFLDFLRILFAMKALAIKAPLLNDPNLNACLEFGPGRDIPVLFQNLLNCLVSIPKYSQIVYNHLGFDYSYDYNQNLEKWALKVFQTKGLGDYIAYQKAFSNPNYYKGALTPLNIYSSDLSLLSVSSQITSFNPRFPLDVTCPNQVEAKNGFRPRTEAFASYSSSQNFLLRIESTLNLTPQLLSCAFLVGIDIVGFKTALQQGKLNSLYLIGNLLDTEWTKIQADYFDKIPNPQNLEPQDQEFSQVSKLDRQSFKNTGVKIKLTKIRRSEKSKVGKVIVKFSNINTLKGDLNPEAISSAENSAGALLISLERCANKLQIDSKTLIKQLLEAWDKGETKVDPSAFD